MIDFTQEIYLLATFIVYKLLRAKGNHLVCALTSV